MRKLPLVVAACALLLAAVAPAASADPSFNVTIGGNGPSDYRFTWVDWWETRLDARLWEAAEAYPAPVEAKPEDAERRRRASAALFAAAASDDLDVRLAAIVALGRMGDEATLDALLGPRRPDGSRPVDGGLIHADDEAVAAGAWFSLGLIGNAEARAFLLRPHELDELSAVGRVAALGMLPPADEAVVEDLARVVRHEPRHEVRRTALWALRTHRANAQLPLLREVLHRSPSPFEAGGVLAALGDAAESADLELVLAVVDDLPDARRLPARRAIDGSLYRMLHGSTMDRLRMEVRTAAALALIDWPVAENRRDQRRTARVLARRASYTTADGRSDFLRGPALLALARHTDGGDADVFFDAFRGVALDPATGEPREDAPGGQFEEVRGFAALAMGLYLHRIDGVSRTDPTFDASGSDLRRQARRMARLLGDAVTDRSEPRELRAAAAIGLGLSGDRTHRDRLASAIARLGQGDQVVAAHAALGLAMLGDPDGAEAAVRLLGSADRAPTAIEASLTRRAASLAVVFAGEARLAPGLAAGWGDDVWGSLSAARAMALARWTGHADAMIAAITDGPSARARSVAAASLGELFDRDHVGDRSAPPRLARLIDRHNYTMSFRNGRETFVCPFTGQPGNVNAAPGWPLRTFHGHADPLLVHHLLK